METKNGQLQWKDLKMEQYTILFIIYGSLDVCTPPIRVGFFYHFRSVKKKKIFQLTAHRKENQKKETTMSTADESFLRGLTPRERREILNLEERLRLERDEVGFSPRRRYY